MRRYEGVSMGAIRDAVILAGGSGTRMLPASLYAPKESLPLVDTPILNHLVWEAARAGVSRVHLVFSERKYGALLDFFEGQTFFDEGVRSDLPRDSLRLGVKGVSIIPHIQKTPGGVADAVSVAIDQINGPFLVLLGDMILLEHHFGPVHSGTEKASNASKELVSEFNRSGLPCVGIYPVEQGDVCNYGVVEISEGMIKQIVEKPSVEDAPGLHVLCGRYIFPEDTKEILQKYTAEEFGELQSIRVLTHIIQNHGLVGVKLDHMKMYDSGDPIVWLKSQIDHALRRDDIGSDLAKWIEERLLN